MLTTRFMQRGITMMEVMVSVAVLAIVMAIGAPALTTWMQNVQVRSTAESVLTGLQLARGEAVRQNNLAQFTLTGDSTGTAGWSVVTASSSVPGSFLIADGATPVQTASANEGGQNARLGVSTAPVATVNCCATAIAKGTGMGTTPKPGVVFNAFGQVISDASVTKISRIDVNDVDGDARRMVITITSSGSGRLCDPSLPASNTRGCP